MAKVIANQPSGKIGNVIYRHTKYGLILTAAPQNINDPKTDRQLRNRIVLGNLAANYRLYRDALPLLFEQKNPSCTDYNMFMAVNHGTVSVYITLQQREADACVIAPYQFSDGTLVPVHYHLVYLNPPKPGTFEYLCDEREPVLVSNLVLGSLVIDKETSVADFSEAIINHNTGWQEGDELYFLFATQSMQAYTGYPEAKMESWHIILNTSSFASDQRLYDQVAPLGFTSVSEPVEGAVEGGVEGTYRLGMNVPLLDSGAAWLHLRHTPAGKIQLSTQHLFVKNDLLESYQDDKAFSFAATSYKRKRKK